MMSGPQLQIYFCNSRKLLAALSTIANSLRDYIELLSEHINKENNILFPLADQHIPQET
jgi:hemerythrin-like domain-containing protein